MVDIKSLSSGRAGNQTGRAKYNFFRRYSVAIGPVDANAP
jgi:hypothetical protein